MADDLLRSVETLVSDDRIEHVRQAGTATMQARRKRVLVVDDSLTVRACSPRRSGAQSKRQAFPTAVRPPAVA